MTAKKQAAKNRAKRPESTEKATGLAVGALVPQPHGGALRNGGTNVGGTGRPPDEIRKAMRGNLVEILPGLLEQYNAGTLDHIRFADFLAKYGLGTKEELSIVSSDVKARLIRQVQVITAALEPDAASALLAQLDAVWS